MTILLLLGMSGYLVPGRSASEIPDDNGDAVRHRQPGIGERLLRRKGLAAAVVAAAALAMAGCSGDGSEGDAADAASSSSTATEAGTEEQRQDILEKMVAERGIVDPPAVDLVRWIDAAEAPSVMAECLTNAGFPASVAADGGMEVEYSNDQEATYNRVLYTCTAEFPTKPATTDAPPEEYVRGLYDYYVETVVPCLEGKGEDIGDVPTWEAFRDTFMQPSLQWHPYKALMESHRLTPEIQAACPAVPEGS